MRKEGQEWDGTGSSFAYEEDDVWEDSRETRKRMCKAASSQVKSIGALNWQVAPKGVVTKTQPYETVRERAGEVILYS